MAFLGLSFGFYELLVYFISGEGALGLRFTTVFILLFVLFWAHFLFFLEEEKNLVSYCLCYIYARLI